MAKKISRSKRRARNLTAPRSLEPIVKQPSSAIADSPATDPQLVYSYPLTLIQRDLVKSMILFFVFIAIVVALTTTQWF